MNIEIADYPEKLQRNSNISTGQWRFLGNVYFIVRKLDEL